MTSFDFQTAPRILCRQGAAAELAELAKSFGAQRVMVVTDNGVMNVGIAQAPLARLREAGLLALVYTDVQADPPEAVVTAAVAAARDAQADLVIGFGGGSSMDTAKLVALLARSPQPLEGTYGIDLAVGPRHPLVLVPTTAGTGSEVTPISIVTSASAEKKGVVSSLLLPDTAVLDSLLTLGVPPGVTAMTGIDSMVHAIESFTSRHKKNPVSDALALQALRLLYDNLRAAVTHGADPDVREHMLVGSMLAGMSFANAPVAAVHALAYPLGGHFHLPHGLSNSLMLPATLRFNLPAAIPHYAALGRAILPQHATSSDPVAAEAFVGAIVDLCSAMPYAQSLEAAGVPRDVLPLLAEDAMNQQRLLVNNPREVSLADALGLYEAAY